MPSVHVLVPAQRYVFAVSDGESEAPALDSSADGFRRYKEMQAEGKAAGMIAFPNTLLIRMGERDYLVDPGLIMQGGALLGALDELGVDPNSIKDVILTHMHYDHSQAMAAWPMRKTYVHKTEMEAPYSQIVSGSMENAQVEELDGEEGEIEPGPALDPHARPQRRPDHPAGRHRRRPGRDRLRLRRPAARVLRRDGPARGLRPRARGAAEAVAADPRPGARDRHPRAQPARQPPSATGSNLHFVEAAQTKELSGEKAQRIIEAMRSSVASRGISGSTFEHVAREAGVSRGLLHYYFGTKEALLVEVVRRDSEHRIARLDEPLGAAASARRGPPGPRRRASRTRSTTSPASGS